MWNRPSTSPDVVDGDDVGVREPGHGLRLAHQPLPQLGAPGPIGAQHLERDPAIELRIVGDVDGAHPALPEHRQQRITPDERAGTRHGRLAGEILGVARGAADHLRHDGQAVGAGVEVALDGGAGGAVEAPGREGAQRVLIGAGRHAPLRTPCSA